MLLCVDGVDPDLVQEYGWGNLFKFNYKLKIPSECFVPDVELGSTPHTTRVWPTIFSGQRIDYGEIKRKGVRAIAHDSLVRAGITWKGRKKKFRISPNNYRMDTIFNHYNSFAWNIPTISPEWISYFPSYEDFVDYCYRELRMWLKMTLAGESNDIEAYYMRYLDYMGHNDWKHLQGAYQNLFLHVAEVKNRRNDVIVLSDHGCKEGLHTNFAYLGSDVPFEALWVHDLRKDFERILDGPLGD